MGLLHDTQLNGGPKPVVGISDPNPISLPKPIDPVSVEPNDGNFTNISNGGPEPTSPPVGISDPNPVPLPGGSIDPAPTTGAPTTEPIVPQVTLEDLYGGPTPTAEGPGATTVADPTTAGVTQNDPGVAEVGTPGAGVSDPTGALSQAAGAVGEQTNLTPEQQVDAELARILGKDSPLLAQARANAAQIANQRGLQNTSMAAGMTQAEMVRAALPMAQQNAAQAAARETANTGFRQQANIFTAAEQNRLTALEAELGTSVSVFNAEQLNRAESLAAQMRTALEQQDTDAFNRAELQLAELQRDAQAQQATIEQANEAQRAAEQQAYNQQIIDRVSQLNEQFLRGSQAMDLATIQGTYQQIIATNTTAGQLYQSYFAGIASVMDDPKMTPSQIATAVSNMQKVLEASLRMIAEINSMDFEPTVPSGGTTPPIPGTPSPTISPDNLAGLAGSVFP